MKRLKIKTKGELIDRTRQLVSQAMEGKPGKKGGSNIIQRFNLDFLHERQILT